MLEVIQPKRRSPTPRRITPTKTESTLAVCSCVYIPGCFASTFAMTDPTRRDPTAVVWQVGLSVVFEQFMDTYTDNDILGRPKQPIQHCTRKARV